MTPPRRLRVLCLHGYHGSGETLRRQMAGLIEGLDAVAEFVCVDAPSLAEGDFGWWHARAGRYVGWERTRDAVASHFARDGPFDGVFGFSQGAALAGLLVGMLEFRFAALVGGFPSADPDLARLYDDRASYRLPTVHIVGRSDAIVAPALSRDLASKFEAPLILEHDGGHVIAATPPIRSKFSSFLDTIDLS